LLRHLQMPPQHRRRETGTSARPAIVAVARNSNFMITSLHTLLSKEQEASPDVRIERGGRTLPTPTLSCIPSRHLLAGPQPANQPALP